MLDRPSAEPLLRAVTVWFAMELSGAIRSVTSVPAQIAALRGDGDSLGAVCGVEFLKNGLQVGFHAVRADVHEQQCKQEDGGSH